jgi:hypothetical protein
MHNSIVDIANRLAGFGLEKKPLLVFISNDSIITAGVLQNHNFLYLFSFREMLRSLRELLLI